MCLRLRDGTFPAKGWQQCLDSDLGRGSFTEDERKLVETGKSMELVGTNAACGCVNGRRVVQGITTEWVPSERTDARGICRFFAEQPTQFKSMTSSKFQGLRSATHVVVGAEQMLMLNINPAVGLANGTIGTMLWVSSLMTALEPYQKLLF